MITEEYETLYTEFELAEQTVPPYSTDVRDNVTKSGLSTAACRVCMVPHDDEIHQATLSLRKWFHQEVTKYFFEDIPVEEEEDGVEWFLVDNAPSTHPPSVTH